MVLGSITYKKLLKRTGDTLEVTLLNENSEVVTEEGKGVTKIVRKSDDDFIKEADSFIKNFDFSKHEKAG